jgi:hypothetical protein
MSNNSRKKSGSLKLQPALKFSKTINPDHLQMSHRARSVFVRNNKTGQSKTALLYPQLGLRGLSCLTMTVQLYLNCSSALPREAVENPWEEVTREWHSRCTLCY